MQMDLGSGKKSANPGSGSLKWGSKGGAPEAIGVLHFRGDKIAPNTRFSMKMNIQDLKMG